ncbi:MAG: hypothetical protein QNK37_25610 [Acidobacteriota bacterium]|nr:hypothetical protein [Acidobacteriota bacterium]
MKFLTTMFLILTLAAGFLMAAPAVYQNPTEIDVVAVDDEPIGVGVQCECRIHVPGGPSNYGVFNEQGRCYVKLCYVKLQLEAQ